MKIKVKGFKSLIKAVQNRAHLFPVKVLVNGKTKTYYSIRYKTGNKAMEIAKKQMKIPNNVEALFDTKDGKRKNLTENDVLRIYDKAGKPGSLQDFIKKNFKKPYVKPRNSTTVDLEQQQMSIDDLMQGNNKKNNKETSGKEKTEKLWQEFEKWRVKANNDLSGIVRSYHKDIEDMNASEYKSIMEHFFKEEIARGYTQNGETIDECLENYIQMFKDQIKDKEDRKNAWNDDYYKEIYNHLEKMHEKGDWTFELDAKKYLRQFLRDKVGLDRYAAQNAGKAALKDILAKNDGDKKEEKKKEPESGITITGPIYDDDERPTYYINDNGNVIETQDTKIVDQYRAKQKEVETEKPGTQGNGQDLDALAEQNQALQEKRTKQKLRENSKEYVEEYKQRNTLNDLNARDRFGTKKIESKGEYQQVANINELIDKSKAIKDYHVDIKGRAILDMLGVNLPMYSKRNGKHFTGKNLGYCRFKIDNETLEVRPYEIGIVAETNNPRRETDAIIHEAMHAKIKGIKQNALNLCDIKGGLLEGEVSHNVEESLVEMAGFSLSKTIHGSENYKEIMAYPEEIALTLPRIWDVEEFKTARKAGINGIGKEIYNQIMAGNKEFIDKIANTYVSDEAKKKADKRTAAIEKTMLDRTDKLEKITGGNEESPIGNLVEELKRGTISLQAALNSSEYGVIAAVLITKFLEDEDLDGIDALIAAL